jgi:hypothetical protein
MSKATAQILHTTGETHATVRVFANRGRTYTANWAVGPSAADLPTEAEALAAWADDTDEGKVKSGNWRRS